MLKRPNSAPSGNQIWLMVGPATLQIHISSAEICTTIFLSTDKNIVAHQTTSSTSHDAEIRIWIAVSLPRYFCFAMFVNVVNSFRHRFRHRHLHPSSHSDVYDRMCKNDMYIIIYGLAWVDIIFAWFQTYILHYSCCWFGLQTYV